VRIPYPSISFRRRYVAGVDDRFLRFQESPLAAIAACLHLQDRTCDLTHWSKLSVKPMRVPKSAGAAKDRDLNVEEGDFYGKRCEKF
jgi:hypothetical protein